MTCEHIDNVLDKINNLVSKINDSDPSICKKINYIPEDKLKDLLDELSNKKDSAERERSFHFSFMVNGVLGAKVINIDGFSNYLKGMFDELKGCGCCSNLSSVKSDLNFYKSRYSDLQSSSDRLERELRDLRGEKEEEIRKLWAELEKEIRGRKNDNVQHNNDKLGWEREKGELQTKVTKKEGEKNTEIAKREGKITGLTTGLRNEKNKVVRLEDKLETRNREIRELTRQLAELRTNNENLRERAGQSREELLTEKIRLKYSKLEIFANQIGINLQQVSDLCRYCERLVHARKNCNQANIETHEDNITRVREELRQRGFQIEDIQKFCDKCEKIAKMRVELNEIRQQQYEARQELPPINNNRISN